jgi:hypothetical protein
LTTGVGSENKKQLTIKKSQRVTPLLAQRITLTGNSYFWRTAPKGGHREVEVTGRRTKQDFVAFVQRLALDAYGQARKIHLVLDNLNTHFRGSFERVMGMEAAAVFLSRLEFHYTPKHASGLNMAEIEIGILDRQCTGRRIGDQMRLRSEVLAWQQQRNQEGRRIDWKFTRQDADQKLAKHYVT